MVTHVSEQPHARDETGPSRRLGALGRRPWAIEALWCFATMLIGFLVAGYFLNLGDAPLHVPWNTNGDGLLNLAVVKGLVQHGWYFTNSSLGAPFHQEQYDYSAFDGDNLQFLILRIGSVVISDPGALINVYYVIGYPLIAGLTFLVLRALGVSRPVALVGGVLYTLLPYHFEQASGHLFLGDYFAVPGAAWMVLQVLTDQPILPPLEGKTGVRRWLRPRTAVVAAICIAAGASTLYYAVFTIMLLGLSALLRGLASRSWRALLPGLGAAVAVGLVLLVNLAPPLLYQHRHGSDEAIARRSPAESEVYSTSLTQLVLPIRNHRIGALARLTDRHTSTTPVPSEIGMHLGFLMAAALIGLLILLVVRTLRGPPATESPRTRLAGGTAIAAGLAFLLGTFGGVGALVAYVLSPQIRAYNRITPFIAFFALVGLVLVLDAARDRIRARAARRERGTRLGVALVGTFLLAVTVLGILDQTPNARAHYEGQIAAWTDDGRFIARVEQALPKNSMILQLPFHAFPETQPTGTMSDYDLFAGYVHSRNLRWSYGAMKGRPEDWTSIAASRPLPEVLRAAVAAGFAGVYIDRNGYDDHGVAVEKTVRRVLGGGPALAGDDRGQLVVYSTQALAARQQQTLSAAQRAQMADQLVRPTGLTFGAGTYGTEPAPDGSTFNWISADGKIQVSNPSSKPRELVFQAIAKAAPGSMSITPPGRGSQRFDFTSGPVRVKIAFTAPPGTSTIAIHADSPNQGAPPDTRDLRVQLFGAAVTSASDSRSNQP
jgi:phosphoglycerol transferase